MALETAQVTQLSPTFRGPMIVPLLSVQRSELPLARVSSFCEYPHHGLNPFDHIIAPSSLQLDSRSSVQCLAVDLCICIHQLLDEGSMMTVKIVINLLTEEGQLRHLLHHCLDS